MPSSTCSPTISRSSRTGWTCRWGVPRGSTRRYLDAMADLVARLDPPWWSEHIAYTRAGGVPIGHLAPLPWTREAVDVVARNVERVRRRIRTPLILENITATVVVPGGEMDEAEFVTAVLDRTGCGLLCDVTNLYTNAVNHGLDLDGVLDRWPWDRVVQLHFAGGHWHDGSLIDSHGHADAAGGLARAGGGRDAGPGARDHPGARREPAAPGRAARRAGPGAGDREAARAMGLAEVQGRWRGLYVDPALRDRFFADPAAVGVELGLGAEEARDLAGVSRRQVEQFADSLRRKRRDQVRRVIPIAARALGDRFGGLFERYADGVGAAGVEGRPRRRGRVRRRARAMGR